VIVNYSAPTLKRRLDQTIGCSGDARFQSDTHGLSVEKKAECLKNTLVISIVAPPCGSLNRMKSRTEPEYRILFLTSFPRTPGGVTSYTKTLVEYCHRQGLACDWYSMENFPVTRLLRAAAQILGKTLASITRRNEQTVTWVLKVLTILLCMRLGLGLRRHAFDRIVCMDVVASCAVSPDVLIVHGAFSDEVARQVSKGYAFRFACIIESQGYRSANRVVAVDPALEVRVRRFHGGRATMIPNPVDLSAFAIRDKDESKRRLGFGTGNKLIAFVGDLPEKFVEQISTWRNQLEALGFATIHISGISYEMMPIYYNAADIVVSMSRVVAFMRTAVEALACGTPIISNNSPLAVYSTPENLVETVSTFVPSQSRDQLRLKALPFEASLICSRLMRVILNENWKPRT